MAKSTPPAASESPPPSRAAPRRAAPTNSVLADQSQRDAIANNLDTTMLVEAAAGTGKTTSMVGRMVALLREGKCTAGQLVAVTFTRKAAAELRVRFQSTLEQATRETTGPGQGRLKAAVAQLDQCVIGTIHSFCARLLRERPVEAGIDLGFKELDEDVDRRLRDAAWDELVARLHAVGDPLLEQLTELGLEITQLGDTFQRFALHPDVADWPASAGELPDLRQIAEAVRQFAAAVTEASAAFPDDPGKCSLRKACADFLLRVRQADLGRPVALMDVLTLFRGKMKATYKWWPGNKAQAVPVEERWNDFAENTARPALQAWYEHRYGAVLPLLRSAQAIYDRQRRQAGGLNFQDLLLRAARLLRDNAGVRKALRRRFTHLLVDEFQDTDPVQAEVLLLLTADDPSVSDWQKCKPVPGALFVVGDPKQSIYRFRRADIVTYSLVKKIVEKNGAVVSLETNFRTIPPVIDWINGVFDAVFPETASAYQPERKSLQAGRSAVETGDLSGVHVLFLPKEKGKNKGEVAGFEPEFVAHTIRSWLNAGRTIPLPKDAARKDARITPGDILIITHGKKRLALYARKLDELGIPNQVSGGSSFQLVEELRLLYDCLRAVTDPDNTVALVAVLRGALFGVSDPALYAFKKAGGWFSFTRQAPADLAPAYAALFHDAFERLTRYASSLRRLPPLAALEKIVADLGLPARAAAGLGGNMRAGCLAKALEALRAVPADQHSPMDLTAHLGRILEEDTDIEGAPAREPGPDVVRLMNLHKAKGLEAPVVFLVDPIGAYDHGTTLHVNREGTQPCGYLAIDGPAAGSGSGPRLAQPPRWAEFEEKEEHFQAAEKERLLYVAATRAGALLVISQREARNSDNPWKFFADALQGCPRLADPGPHEAPSAPATAISAAECAAARDRGRAAWEAALRPSYRVLAAKAFAADGKRPTAPLASERTGDAYGTEWGTVIHLLMETAVRHPEADLLKLARESLAEQDDVLVARAEEAVALVERVRSSKLWERVAASQRRLVEVPFETLWPLNPNAGELPTVVRGVIDLIFREADGWVIVDYKTHAAASHTNIVEEYGNQVRLYTDVWCTIVKEPVHEAGLYLTHADEYVRIV
jgi:ATP-dependent helicase/nuclease subunit A